jgi:serine/threonine-protein kinase
VFDVTEEAGVHSIVMEYFHGKDLKRLILEQGRFSAVDTIYVGAQVADGLAYAHAQGIVHRDIKPGNIMLNDRRRVKIADFGIAAATDEISVTATGQIIGTPEYMSPEQARGEPLDGRSDLYSLGMVLYEMLTGQTPFAGISRMAIVGKLVYEKDELVLSFPEDVTAGLRDLVRTLLKKQPGDRLPDASALLARFRALDPSLGVTAAPAHTDPSLIAPPPSLASAGHDPPTLLYQEGDQTGTVQATPPPRQTLPPVPRVDDGRRDPSPAAAPRQTASPAAMKHSGPLGRLAPRAKPGWVVPFSAGLVGVVAVLAAIAYYLSGTVEPPPPPIPQRPVSEPAPVSLTELRDAQTSIQTVRDEMTRSAEAADAAQAPTRAPTSYGRATDLRDEAVASLEKGATLITQRHFADAKTALEDSVARFGQARESFVRARDAAVADAEVEAKQQLVEVQRAKKARSEAAKRAAKARTPAPPAATASVPPRPPQSAVPSRPDIEVVGAMLSALKSAYEHRDLRTLQQTTVMSDGRARFLQQIFAEYPVVGISISGLSMTPDTATAMMLITKLVNRQGDPVIPGTEWKNAKLIVKKQGGEWGKVVW